MSRYAHADIQILASIENGVLNRGASSEALVPESTIQRVAALVDMAIQSGETSPEEAQPSLHVSVCTSSDALVARPFACADTESAREMTPAPGMPADARAFVLLPLTGTGGIVIDPDHASVAHLTLGVASRVPRQWTSKQIVRLTTVAATVAAEIRARADFIALERIADGLRRYSLRDTLTELANRELLIDRLDQAILRSSRHKDARFGLFSLNLDQFANIEATLGYDAADDVLIDVAKRLQTVVRGFDTVARLGGDDFVLLVDGVTDHDAAANVAGRIRDALRSPITTRWGDTVIVSASIGIVLSASGTDSPARLLQLAGMARARAKTAGTGFEFFDQGMQEQAQRRLRRETELRRGIEAGEFELYYQPIVSLETGRVRQLEALIRWRHPDRGLITASEFVPLAEETGVIVPMGWWVLAQSCPQLADWRRRFGADLGLTVSVNVGAVHLVQRDIVARVEAVLLASGLPGNCVNLEITESALIAEPARIRATLEALGSLGVAIHLDDFGSGYSSLRYLQELPLNAIKIDRAFIAQMPRGGRHVQMVATIRELARQIGATVIAEGIETPDQLELAQSLQCEYGQGYFLAEPMPAAQIEALLSTSLIVRAADLPSWHSRDQKPRTQGAS